MDEEGHGSKLVFPSPTGNALSPSNVRIRSFLPAQKTAEIDPPIRFHDLRHTAATLMLSAGVHPKVVSERLGHASIAITMDTYQHVSPSMQQDAARRLSALLLGKTAANGPQKRASETRNGATGKAKSLTKRSIS